MNLYDNPYGDNPYSGLLSAKNYEYHYKVDPVVDPVVKPKETPVTENKPVVNLDAATKRFDELRAQVDLLLEGICSIQRYLSGPKFWKDSTVHSGDILTRIAEIKASFTDLTIEQEGEVW